MKDSLYWGHGWAWMILGRLISLICLRWCFVKGAVEVTVVPGSLQGDTASVSPVSLCLLIIPWRTGQRHVLLLPESISLSRDWLTNGNNLIVTGNVPTFRKDLINIYDSGSFFMHTFGTPSVRKESWFESLRFYWITVPMEQSRWLAGETPVQKVLNQLMKESDNLNAEAMLCWIASQATGKKRVTAEDGIVEIMKLVRNLGHDPKDYIRSRMVADCLIIITCLLPCWSIFWNMPIHNPMFFRIVLSRFLLPE